MGERYYVKVSKAFLTRPNRPRHKSRKNGLGSENYALAFVSFIFLTFALTNSNPVETEDSGVLNKDVACSNVKYAYTAKGIFREDDVPQEAISGEHLQICQRGMTCCTQEMEDRLKSRSTAEFNRFFKETVGEIRNIYATRAHKFDEFFRSLLDRSKKGFHKMFVKTYGMLYETNSYLFEDMFQDLETYYNNGNIDLSDALDNFFNRLYKKMFQVLNGQYTFTEKYLTCVGEQMEALKPFGDLPKKLILEIKRSFIATRTFYQALCVARDVLKVLSEIGLTHECTESLMKMTYCPHCQGLPDLKPCNKYCLGVMRQCLPHDAELSSEWRNFTTNLDSLGGRLETSFNIQSVVDPINIKISEAIMNFQENGVTVSSKLFDTCGKPKLGSNPHKRDVSHESYPRRDAGSSELHFEKFKFSSDHTDTTNENPSNPDSEEPMNALVQSIRKKIKRTAPFWKQLPSKLCNNPDMGGDVPDGQDCWNGHIKEIVESKINNEEITTSETKFEDSIQSKIESSHQNAIVNQQVLSLKLITTKLQHAYNGLDVLWQDVDSDWISSGSGSGSGYGPTENDVTSEGYSDIYFSSSTAEPKGTRDGVKRKAVPKQQDTSSCVHHNPSWRTFLFLALACCIYSMRNVS